MVRAQTILWRRMFWQLTNSMAMTAVVVAANACDSSHSDKNDADSPSPAAVFTSQTILPYADLGLNSGIVDVNGKPARVKCLTCHDKIEVQKKYTHADKLEKFHTGMKLEHGDNTCRSCHNAPLFQDFRLASGRTLAYADVIELCTQCHGGQRNDYEHGAHGGMNGYWDLSRGARTRNHCLDCHNAHQPAYTQMMPAPFPKYRFLERSVATPAFVPTAAHSSRTPRQQQHNEAKRGQN